MNDLLGFAASLIEHEGGVADASSEGSALDVLLPPSLVSLLKLDEQVRLRAEPGERGSGGIPLVYGSDLLEKMIARVTSSVPGVSAQLQGVLFPNAAMVEAAGRSFWLRNGVSDLVETRRAATARLIVHAVLTLKGDEQRQALLSGAWSVGSQGFVERFSSMLDPQQLVEAPLLNRTALEAIAPAVQGGLWWLGETICKDFVGRQQQRFDRDRERMHLYFHDMREELRLRVLAGKLTDTAAAERREAIDRDQQAKLDVLKGRFVLQAELRPIACVDGVAKARESGGKCARTPPSAVNEKSRWWEARANPSG